MTDLLVRVGGPRAGVPGRLIGVDVLRGLAVAAMVVDHAALVAAWAGVLGTDLARWTVGRVALPVFFVLAGALAHRIGWRLAWIALLGAFLGVLIPWLSAPNVLVVYAVGVVGVVAVARWWGRLGLWGMLVAQLVLLANGLGTVGDGYPVPALLGFMACGALVGRYAVARLGEPLAGGWWGRCLEVVGRHPLLWYAGHLIFLDALALWNGWGVYQ